MNDSTTKDACRHFRERFQLGVQDPHRDVCGECSRFAEVLESSMSTENRRSMPAGLRSRLRGIPRHEVTCRDTERLYREARRRAGVVMQPSQNDRTDANDRISERDTAREHDPASERDPASEQHLASCERCSEIYGTLQCALEPERLAMSARLARRLTELAKHPQRLVPLWISDARYAAAACYLLAAMTLTVADDASAVLRGTTESLSNRVGVWATTGEARRSRVWDVVSSSLEQRLETGWNRAESYREASERWLSEAYRDIESTTRELIPDHDRSVEGGHDDRSKSDGT